MEQGKQRGTTEYTASEIREEDKKVEIIAKEYEKGSKEWNEMRTTVFFQYLKDEKLRQFEKDGMDSAMLEDGTRIKNPRENSNDLMNEEYVEINRYIFMLDSFMKTRATQYEKEEIRKIIYGPIPLTMEAFRGMRKERKTAIRGMIKYLADSYNLTEHWREDFEWALAEIMMVNIVPKFLNKLTDCGCLALRANRFDDIKNKIDLFIISTNEDLSYNIGIDVTLRKKKNLKTKKDKLFKLNTRKPTSIEYGLRYEKESGFVRSKISRPTWFYARIDWNLLQEYVMAVNKNNKDEIEKTEKKIFIIFCENIKEEFKKLEEERVKIQEKYEELKLEKDRKSIEHSDAALKNARPFVERTNQALNILREKR